MSDIERSCRTSPGLPDVQIQTIQKPKRVYKKKIVEVIPPLDVVPETVIPEPVAEKPKRKYTPRKPKEPAPEPAPAPEIVAPEIVSPEPAPAPEPAPVPAPKKPRTDKQIQAFNKMREQRLLKTAKINELKQFEKEKRLMDKEEARLEKLREKLTKSKNSKIASDEPPYLEQHISPLAEKRANSPTSGNSGLSPEGDNYRLASEMRKLSTIPKYVFV